MKLSGLLTTVRTMVWNILHRQDLLDVVDIILVAVVIYELLKLTSHTRGSAVLKGLAALLVVVVISNILGLTALNWLLMTVVSNGAIVLLILFQPELRKALEQVGRNRIFTGSGKMLENAEHMENELVTCLLDLSRSKTGALIVIEQKIGLKDVVETGTQVDAVISAALLENIFVPNTPLHDGAVVIRDDRIVAGACILPLTEAQGVSLELGTRHRAGLGLSEATDALVLIVSEETGTISVASEGKMLRHLDEKQLREILNGKLTARSSGLLDLLRTKTRKEEA